MDIWENVALSSIELIENFVSIRWESVPMSTRTKTIAVPDAAAKAFRGADDGSVAIIFAFCCLFLAAFVGGAVDFARLFQSRTAYQEALDGAVLAGARAKQLGASDDEAVKVAEAYISTTRARYPAYGTIQFSVTDVGTAMYSVADLQLPTSFLSVVKLPTLPLNVKTTATFGQAPDVEMSLMLDTTGSMGGQKIKDLKDAVQDLIDIVINDNDSASTSRIGVAPFAATVKLKNKQFDAATGRASGGHKRCVVERAGDERYTDAAPGAGQYVTPIEDVSKADCKDAKEVFGLSNKKSDLKKMVNSLEAGGTTAGHLGTAWAWYILSPNWGGAFDTGEQAASYQDLKEKKANGMPKLRKIAVLMTDGEYNTEYLNADSATQARALCANMKTTGIEVYTIGFQIGGVQSAIETLTDCASAASNFYKADDGDALRAAFRDIALKASSLRVSQ